MGKLAQDAKNLILGNDGSDKEPLDFKTELENAIKAGLITKSDGTLLITSRENMDKLAKLISREEEKEVTKAAKENGFDSPEAEQEYYEKKKKKEKERKRQENIQKNSLEQQIKASQSATKARMASERNLEKDRETDRNK